LWKLPEQDGVGVRFEGTYRQLVKRPNSQEGDTQIEWRRRLKISSVGQEEAEFRGELQPCRWIEFKLQTGHAKEGDIDSGPGSTRIYKLLIPEASIRGELTEPLAEDREVFVSFIPIIRGFRKIGDESAQPVTGTSFQLFPLISTLQHYRELTPRGGAESLQLPIGPITAEVFEGTTMAESPSIRTTSSAEIFRSDELPFGVAKWVVKTVTAEKPPTAARSEFATSNEIVEELQALEVFDGAESELITD
jgi:hypothetical protein